MYVNDPIADLLTRIRNAQMAGHPSVKIPASIVKGKILEILEEEGFVLSVEKQEGKPQSWFSVELKYNAKTDDPIISELRRISKPGRRVYMKASELHPFRNGFGVYVLSTSNGVITDKKARSLNVGGELLFSIW